MVQGVWGRLLDAPDSADGKSSWASAGRLPAGLARGAGCERGSGCTWVAASTPWSCGRGLRPPTRWSRAN